MGAPGRKTNLARRRLFQLFLAWLAVLFALSVVQVVVARQHSRQLVAWQIEFREAAARRNEEMRGAMTEANVATAELKERFESGSMSGEEWETETRQIHERFHRAAMAPSLSALPVAPNSYLRGVTVLATLATVALCILFWLLLAILGVRTLVILRAKGYTELRLADGMWLSLRLGRGVRRLPNADDFLTLPGATESAASLIHFAKQLSIDKKP